jgi:hypothetical protein
MLFHENVVAKCVPCRRLSREDFWRHCAVCGCRTPKPPEDGSLPPEDEDFPAFDLSLAIVLCSLECLERLGQASRDFSRSRRGRRRRKTEILRRLPAYAQHVLRRPVTTDSCE